MSQPLDEALDAVSVLVDPVRRAMYRFARTTGRPVSREEVAEATGTSVKLAAFHLDKLVEHGWLRTRYDQSSRPKTGGRPPKLYEPTDRRVELSIPARRYDLMAEILLQASADDAEGTAARARQAAYDRGRSVAKGLRASGRRRLGPEPTLAAAAELLAEVGFEPRRSGTGEVIVAHCPFQSLAESAPGTVCQAAQGFVEGMVAGMGGSGVEAVRDRAAGRCCVVLRRSSARHD